MTHLTITDVTFGITAFERPHLLRQLVYSILRNYPCAKIVVADNGRRAALLPSSVRVLKLPFDCGLSAARNALTAAVDTKLMLLLEEDFLFLPETRIEPLINVLNHDSEVGVVGAAMRSVSGQTIAYSMDIEIFRDTMTIRQSTHRQMITNGGTSYRICHMTWNFALFRKAMLDEHRWDELLKVGEHAPYFNEVRKAARWRVACCPETIFSHVPDQRSAEYMRYRSRAAEMFQSYLRSQGLSKSVRIAPQPVDDPLPERPNIVVMGVGHSGTTILTKMLHQLGWELGDADEEYAESNVIRELNMRAITSFRLPAEAFETLSKFASPWAIKDPRFVWTLQMWLPVLARLPDPPLLVRIRRNSYSVAGSYARRNASIDSIRMLGERELLCDQKYRLWPWKKLTIEYEQLVNAAVLFDRKRVKTDALSALGAHQPGLTAGPFSVFDGSIELHDGSPLFADGSDHGARMWDVHDSTMPTDRALLRDSSVAFDDDGSPSFR